jgi:hypothetical protein
LSSIDYYAVIGFAVLSPAFISTLFAVYYIVLFVNGVCDETEEALKLKKIDRNMVLAFLGVKGEPPEDINKLLDKYENVLFLKMSPRCIFEEAPEFDLQGEDIKTHLKDCGKIILIAATLGLPVDELIRQTEASDMAGAVVLDALASAAVEQVCDMAEIEIKKKYGKITTRYSPGYGDFPLSVQHELLAVLEAKKKIGLYVTQDGLLIPRKSITAIIGVIM